jgi:hypothetical protein
MKYASQALPRRRLLFLALALGGVLFLSIPTWGDRVQAPSSKGKVDFLKAKKSPWGAGIASFMIPGTGQFFNGEHAKGFIHLGVTAVGLGVMFSGNEHSDKAGARTRYGIGMLTFTVVRIWSGIDAYFSAEEINWKNGYTAREKPSVGLVFVPDPRNPRRLQPGVGLQAGF